MNVPESPIQPYAPPGAESTWLAPPPAPPAAAPYDEPGRAAELAPAPLFAPAQLAPAAAAPETVRPDPPIPNGGFDDSATGWRGSNSALALVHGVSGKAVRVQRANSRAAFAIVAGKPVPSTKAGARYRAGAFVRTVSPGMFVCLRAEEFGRRSAGVPVTNERCAAATTEWQRLKLDLRTTAKGTRLVFSVRVVAALGGTSFDVDGFRLAAS